MPNIDHFNEQMFGKSGLYTKIKKSQQNN